MINICSAVTSITLAGGKHYKVRGSTSYTIINDLASVASELPRIPTADCTSVLRHVSTRLSKDYTYRPNRVYRALNWLKRNNHLYEHVRLKWSAEIMDWANNEECVHIPFIEVTDEEEVLNEIPVPGDTPLCNPGIYTYVTILLRFVVKSSSLCIFFLYLQLQVDRSMICYWKCPVHWSRCSRISVMRWWNLIASPISVRVSINLCVFVRPLDSIKICL